MKEIVRFAFALFLALVLAGCGGGGSGGDSEDEGSGAAPAAPTSADGCGLLGLNLKIINGSGCANSGSSPIVRVISNFDKGPGYCSGTLITPTKVLTAGHCIQNIHDSTDKRFETQVIVDVPGGQEVIPAATVELHPQFTIVTPHVNNDMAIVTLSHSVPNTTLPVLTSRALSAGETVNVYGYGTTQPGTPPFVSFDTFLSQPLQLESGQMTLSQVSDTHYRAEAIAGQTTLCHGDSGGPLIVIVNGRPAVAGVTSLVQANGQTVHCAPGTYAEWTKLQSPVTLNGLLALVPDVQTQ